MSLAISNQVALSLPAEDSVGSSFWLPITRADLIVGLVGVGGLLLGGGLSFLSAQEGLAADVSNANQI